MRAVSMQDLDDTLDALIEAASRYDRRQLGPAGLKAWEVYGGLYFIQQSTTNEDGPFSFDACE